MLQYNSNRTSDSRVQPRKQPTSNDNSLANNSNYLLHNLGSRIGPSNMGEIPASPILSESDIQTRNQRKYNDSSYAFSRHQPDNNSSAMLQSQAKQMTSQQTTDESQEQHLSQQ